MTNIYKSLKLTIYTNFIFGKDYGTVESSTESRIFNENILYNNYVNVSIIYNLNLIRNELSDI